MVVHGQLVEPAVCLSDLYDVFVLDTVRDTRQNLWTLGGGGRRVEGDGLSDFCYKESKLKKGGLSK